MKHIPFETLSEYTDGRLPDRERHEIEEHAAVCADCRKTLLSIQNTNMVVKSLEKVELSKAFDRNFKAKLADRVKAGDEQKLGLVVEGLLGGFKDAVLSPVFAGAVAFVAATFFVYGILNYYPVESPKVLLAEGSFSVLTSGGKDQFIGKDGYRLARGDTLEVAEGSIVDIAQGGKYVIRVKSASRICLAKALPRFVKGSVVYTVERGKAFISIYKGFKGSSLLVKTPEATATALGTMFMVDVAVGPKAVTKLSVLEGNVRVESELKQVIVGGGKMTEVSEGQAPSAPRELLEKEWAELAEFYQIGHKAQVALLISDGPDRVRELLRPCPLYIKDVEPRTVGESLEETISLIDDAIKTKDRAKHLDGIKWLEAILARYPNADYEPQLLLFIGSYYNYLNRYDDAVFTFRKVFMKYPKSTFASMALYAIRIVYDRGLKDADKARYYYDLVLRAYPKSPEAISIKKLGRK